jgi:hypothetical protein
MWKISFQDYFWYDRPWGMWAFEKIKRVAE